MVDRGATPATAPAGSVPDDWPARPELILALNRMGGFDWDLDTGVLHMDASALELFDLSPEEFNGRLSGLAGKVLRADAADLDAQVTRALKEVTTTTKNESGSDAGDYAIGESTLQQAALQRHLKPRQVQFFAIGGSIGTALFITIGYGLLHGGAGSLLIAFILQSIILSLVNNALAEMTIFMPVSAAFIQHADVWVDKAWAFMIGWNFFLFEAILVPFEITALDLILTYWRDDIPSAAVISACIFTYGFA